MRKQVIFAWTGVLLISLLSYSCQNRTSQKAIDPVNMDLTVNPAEDFHLYANGGWMKLNPLPEDKGRYGTFDQLIEENDRRVRELVTGLAAEGHEPGSVPHKIGVFYSMGMDTVTIEEQRLEPLQETLNEIGSVNTMADLQEMIAQFHASRIESMFSFFGKTDPDNSDMNILWLYQGGLGMADRDYYTDPAPRFEEIRNKYVQHLTRMFTLLGDSEEEAAANAMTVMRIETRLAEHSMTRLEQRDPYLIKNKMEQEQLEDLCGQFNWNAYFHGIGLSDPGTINVGQPDFFGELSLMLSEIPVDQWKTYLRWNLINSTANYLGSDFVDEDFAFYGKVMRGIEAQRPRWERVISATNRALGEALGQMYVKTYFPPEAKDDMLTLVSNLKVSLASRIRGLEWMGDTTKEKALEKLEVINVKIGYPDKWRDYSDLDIRDDSYVGNVLRSRKFEVAYNVGKIGKPVDPDEWFMTPQTVNAYYSPAMNEICFPAGILQPPFYYLDADKAVNYGAIGVVIGHEMTHGFDDQGRKYDKEGNLKEWWTESDAERFNDRAEVLIHQFDQFVVLDTVRADGELTLGENIADLGGLNISYEAYKAATQDTEPESIDGFTPDQRFFLSYAHLWAQNVRDEEILRRTKEDVHSLGRFRVIGPLRNMPEFISAFNIQPDDPMYLPEEARAVIW